MLFGAADRAGQTVTQRAKAQFGARSSCCAVKFQAGLPTKVALACARTYPLGVNRRNYYRILHVQPEAPGPIIPASYRAMMSKLRLHPDLGGDTAGAALINEAYAVLSDPAKRASYDQKLRTGKPVSRNRGGV